MGRTDIGAWYDQNHSQYQDLITTVERLLTTLLKDESIPYHSVGGRLKEKRSLLAKWEQKAYTAPEQIMDVAGLRIITHTTEEVQKVCALIEQELLIDEKNSGDKAQKMGVDQVGYLSVHYIAKIDDERLKLREYKRFKGLCFEIQVRSLLQHAWAEIEHDRSYKFAGVLPLEIRRKFYLVAGTLELMDQEFNALSQEIDHYATHVKSQTKEGNLNIPIDSTSLLQFLQEYFKDYDHEKLSRHYSTNDVELVAELSDFGIKTLQGLNELLAQKTPAEWAGASSTNYVGILHVAMILKDTKKYFDYAWKAHWTVLNNAALEHWKNLGVSKGHLEQYITLKEYKPGHFDIEKRHPN